MSGLEIAGVVLGAFPLAVSALEHWRELARSAGLFRYYALEHQKCLNDIKDEGLKLRLLVRSLLIPLVHEDKIAEDDLESLIANPGGDGWRCGDTEEALRQRLGDIFDRYVEILSELSNAIFKLLASLHSTGQAQDLRSEATTASCNDTKDLFQAKARNEYLKAHARYRMQKLKFSFDSEGRKERLTEIRSTNQKLFDFLELADRCVGYGSRIRLHSDRGAGRALVDYSAHAASIYRALQSSWRCACKQHHRGDLWLQHHVNCEQELRLLVHWGHSDSATCVNNQGWDQRGLKITWSQVHTATGPAFEAFGAKSKASTVSFSLLVASSDATAGISGIEQTVKNPEEVPFNPQRRGRFKKWVLSLMRGQTQDTGAVSCPQTIDTRPSLDAAVTSPESNSLCGDLIAVSPDQQLLRTLRGATRYLISADPKGQAAKAVGKVSLAQILERQILCEKRPVDRLQVAFDIASAHVRFQKTAWMRESLTTDNIFFPQSSARDEAVVLNLPHISIGFLEDETRSDSSQTKKKCPSLQFAFLGVMLLELWSGSPIEGHALWQELGVEQLRRDPDVRTMVALKWADAISDAAGPEFIAAVNWCLRLSPATLESELWRRQLADKVVQRLYYCYEWWKNGVTARV